MLQFHQWQQFWFACDIVDPYWERGRSEVLIVVCRALALRGSGAAEPAAAGRREVTVSLSLSEKVPLSRLTPHSDPPSEPVHHSQVSTSSLSGQSD